MLDESEREEGQGNYITGKHKHKNQKSFHNLHICIISNVVRHIVVEMTISSSSWRRWCVEFKRPSKERPNTRTHTRSFCSECKMKLSMIIANGSHFIWIYVFNTKMSPSPYSYHYNEFCLAQEHWASSDECVWRFFSAGVCGNRTEWHQRESSFILMCQR